MHSRIDDHSRLAYCEVHDDEIAITRAGFWPRALAFFAHHAITVTEVICEHGPAYQAIEWARVNAAAGITTRRTRPNRPQANGTAERFQRTLRDEWGYAKAYRSESSHRAGLDQLAPHPHPSQATNRTRRQTPGHPRDQRH